MHMFMWSWDIQAQFSCLNSLLITRQVLIPLNKGVVNLTKVNSNHFYRQHNNEKLSSSHYNTHAMLVERVHDPYTFWTLVYSTHRCILHCLPVSGFPLFQMSSAESQKGAIADQRCSLENQKGAIAIDFVQQ